MDAVACVRSLHVLQQSSACVLNSRMSLLQGKPGEAVPKLKQDWKDAMIANWKLWPFFQFVNFRFVPPEQRVRSMGHGPCQMQSVFLLHCSSTLGQCFLCLHLYDMH
jgi:Mpv17 / PMP22 family